MISFVEVFISVILACTVQFSSTFSILNHKCPLSDETNQNACQCFSDQFDMSRCCCYTLETVPQNLPLTLTSMYLLYPIMSNLTGEALSRYSNLHTFYVKGAKALHYLDGSILDSPRLRMIMLEECSNLNRIQGAVTLSNKHGLIMKVTKCALASVPKFITGSHHMEQTISLSYNSISTLPARCLENVTTHSVDLSFNNINSIETSILFHASITVLNLSWNPIEYFSDYAFYGMHHLHELDLSHTKIVKLPDYGLNGIKKLSFGFTPTLKELPSIYAMPAISEITTTYPYHCCYFKHAARREAIKKSELNLIESLQSMWEKQCSEKIPEDISQDSTDYEYDEEELDMSLYHVRIADNTSLQRQEENDIISYINMEYSCRNYSAAQRFKLDVHLSRVKCTPKPNALNPCEDVLNWSWLRMLIWISGLFAIGGNLTVIVAMCIGPLLKQRKVTHLLLINLAVADLLVGTYLGTLAMIDIRTAKFYYNYAVDWQNGVGCKIAGFLAVFGGQLSVAMMALLSFEVWYNTKYLFYGRRFEWKTAINVVFLCYIFLFVLSTLPWLDLVGSYGSTSTCLPIRYDNTYDKVYIISILLIDTSGFLYIVFNYAEVYFTVKGNECPWTHIQDVAIAKRMAILIGADFLCWVPIIIIGWISVTTGKGLIDVSSAKVLLVLFFPINASTNPFLYVFLTKMFKNDFSVISRKYIWVRRVSDSLRRHRSRVNLSNSIQSAPLKRRHSLSSFLFHSSNSVLSTLSSWASGNGSGKKGSGSSHSTKISDFSTVSPSRWRQLFSRRFTGKKGCNSVNIGQLDLEMAAMSDDNTRRISHDSNIVCIKTDGALSKYYAEAPPNENELNMHNRGTTVIL